MVTKKQLRANRMNARFSTGPTTEDRKALSRENAFRHGAYSKLVQVSFEDERIYQEIYEGLLNQFNAGVFTELALLEKLSVCLLRDMRLAAAESIQMDLLPILDKNGPVTIPTDPEVEDKTDKWRARNTVLSFDEQKKLFQLQAMLNNETRKLLAELIAECDRNDALRQKARDREKPTAPANDNNGDVTQKAFDAASDAEV